MFRLRVQVFRVWGGGFIGIYIYTHIHTHVMVCTYIYIYIHTHEGYIGK